nr:sporulation protein [Paracoccus saliphilus]
MLGKLLRTFGVGGATIDAVLESDEVVVGETLRGEVQVKGGGADQSIRGVTFELITRCIVETRGDEKVYANLVLASGMIELDRVRAGENLSAQIEIDVPAHAPISIGSTSTFLRTRLNVAGAADPKDMDVIQLRPTAAMLAVLRGMEQAGFSLAETEVEHNPHRPNPFVQEFDFRPRSARDYGVEEVEISFSPIPGGVEVLLTVDNRGGFFTSGRERSTRFRVTDATRLDMAAELWKAIDALR